MHTLPRASLAGLVASHASYLNSRKASELIDVIVDEIASALKLYGEVRVPDFGTFTIQHRAARKFRNPITGGTVDAPAKDVIKIKVSKVFSKKVLGCSTDEDAS